MANEPTARQLSWVYVNRDIGWGGRGAGPGKSNRTASRIRVSTDGGFRVVVCWPGALGGDIKSRSGEMNFSFAGARGCMERRRMTPAARENRKVTSEGRMARKKTGLRGDDRSGTTSGPKLIDSGGRARSAGRGTHTSAASIRGPKSEGDGVTAHR